jgi:DNA repair protein RadC
MDQICNAQSAFLILKKHFNPDCEEFWLLTLNTQLCILNTTLLSRGTLNFCLVHPRDLFRKAIVDNAYQIIIAHNHPSLCVKPTAADIKLTKRLKKISKLIEIPIIDHIIFSSENYFSFKENKIVF